MKLIEGQQYDITTSVGTFRRIYLGTDFCEFDLEPQIILKNAETQEESSLSFSRVKRIEEVVSGKYKYKEGWKLHIPASSTGTRRAYDFCHLGVLERAKEMVPKSLQNLAKKQGTWTPMSQQEIEDELTRIEEGLDQF